MITNYEDKIREIASELYFTKPPTSGRAAHLAGIAIDEAVSALQRLVVEKLIEELESIEGRIFDV